MPLLDSDLPDLDFYIEVEVESINRRLTAMMNDVDSQEDWQQERLEASDFDAELKSHLVEYMFEKKDVLDVMIELHKATNCSLAIAFSHAENALRLYYKDLIESASKCLRNLNGE